VSTSAQRSRRREQREQTRRRILAAADAFLRERPYRELSVEVVMTRTGLTRTAFYRHFDDVPDIVLRLLEDVGGELYAVAHRWSESAGHDYPNAAHAGLAGIVDFFVRHGRLVRAVADAAATDEQIEQGYAAFVNAFTEMIAVTLDRLVASDRLDVPDSRAMARALNLMNEAYLLDAFGREPIGDRDVALATLETIWLRVLGLR
jgi:TetR/AcrR family transcriptional regulator, ethionamide resistance regulator